ncbi:MAG: hypothetical protein L6R19_21045 [Alphaproteobacteria bacterium]|nr:hypothetical protein [Alphaproteobacteria bacterium]
MLTTATIIAGMGIGAIALAGLVVRLADGNAGAGRQRAGRQAISRDCELRGRLGRVMVSQEIASDDDCTGGMKPWPTSGTRKRQPL